MGLSNKKMIIKNDKICIIKNVENSGKNLTCLTFQTGTSVTWPKAIFSKILIWEKKSILTWPEVMPYGHFLKEKRLKFTFFHRQRRFNSMKTGISY